MKKIQIDHQQFMNYYDQRYNDVMISKIVGCSDSTIRDYRIKLNLPKNHLRSNRIIKDICGLKKLVEQGLSDKTIASILNVHWSVAAETRRTFIGKKSRRKQFDDKIKNTNYFDIFEDKFKLAILCGTILGDGNICDSSFYTSKGSISHCEKQLGYLLYKQTLLKGIVSDKVEHMKRTSDSIMGRRIIHPQDSYRIQIKASPSIKQLHKIIYDEYGKRRITKELLSLMDENSIAIHFYDDGYKRKKTDIYTIAMCAFDGESIKLYQEWLLGKFLIETSLQKNNILYIKTKSSAIFKSIIGKHNIECMRYKV